MSLAFEHMPFTYSRNSPDRPSSNQVLLTLKHYRSTELHGGFIHNKKAQATVEAAFAIPILMILILLLLQPGIVLYDRIVMHGAAEEGCRLLTTSNGADQSNEDYIRRRLSAVPQVDIFHVHNGECSWDIEFSGNERQGEVSVKISNELKPLPLLDSAMTLAGLVNGNGNLKIEVSASQKTQPEWVDRAAEGRDPHSWPGI